MAPLAATKKLARTFALGGTDIAATVLAMSVALYTVHAMIIDCDSCVVREIKCHDCVVSVLIGRPPAITSDESRVIDLLASRGMVPPLRFELQEDSQPEKYRSG